MLGLEDTFSFVFVCLYVHAFLHGLLLFSFCCCSSPRPSKNRVALFAGLGGLSAGSSPAVGLVLLTNVSTPFESGCSCGAAERNQAKEER